VCGEAPDAFDALARRDVQAAQDAVERRVPGIALLTIERRVSDVALRDIEQMDDAVSILHVVVEEGVIPNARQRRRGAAGLALVRPHACHGVGIDIGSFSKGVVLGQALDHEAVLLV